jgi:serine/threonine-protein kinase RsbW
MDGIVTPEGLRLMLPAKAENVMVVRQAVAGLGEALGLPEARIADLKTVVTEACNNVVLHAYSGEPGPLEITATPGDDAVEVTILDYGQGFEPRPNPTGEATLGLGLPLIASLSDGFQISGKAGEGTSTSVRFAYQGDERRNGKPDAALTAPELSIDFAPGMMVRPVLARVIGALAARAEFSVDRLADTVLLGDAVSAGEASDFSDGRVGITIEPGDGTLDVRVGPLNEGAGERLMAQMELPGHGSLRSLARSVGVERGETEDGRPAEFLTIEVAN